MTRMAAAGVTGEGAVREGAAPSAVSMAVLGVEGALLGAVLFVLGVGALPGPGAGTAFAVAPLLLVLVLFAATVLTVAYVLPAVLLAHWTARQLTGRIAWWWIPPACTLWVLPALAVPSWQLTGFVLYAAVLPPALTTHHTVVRAEEGRPVQPCAAILGWGTLVVLGVAAVGAMLFVRS
ncbi:hypothetical protein PV332_37610 [Streptomyces scabiei]|nr:MULTISPECIES: hypothetical protein [Streptomyces]MBP5863058.1 hypothetical protein [Streptomyces sp. LBUM 1484]MBP5868010.1 hypothetical protein [Streptomyces sp. LBUM 1485]KFG03613.1 hypothetical protein IQ61_40115 [Streptomyces scabiei]MBP5876465.1 hypothetical protein [Streptomyces sp. LBUM 1477]MBP5884221.1 hypothetical protein [Streptomyces sp. LBUM 1487]